MNAPRLAAILGAGGLVLATLAYSAGEPARRIVTLAPHLTELTYSAGAGDRLVGADAYSDYPPEARALPRVGDAFQVDYERLLALRPDLVLVWTTGMPEPVIERIGQLGVHVERVTTAHLADIAAAIVRIGELAGTRAEAQRAADEYSRQIAALRQKYGGRAPLRVLYQISEQPLYTVSGHHVISELIELCGGRNIFAELEQVAPPVGLEAVLERDPEVIITADGAQGEPLAVWRRWTRMRAVRLDNLYTVSADRVARPTTRIVAGAEQICAVLESARQKRSPGATP
jgi:iron complex transport system substrate-binding protein